MNGYTGRPGIDWGSIAQAISIEKTIRDFQQDQKDKAIQWQGQQDYQTLVDSGITPVEALKRTASKIFYNDPRAFSYFVGKQESGITPEEGPTTRTLEDGSTAVWTGNTWRVIPKKAPGREEYVDVETTLPSGEKERRRIPVAEREQQLKAEEIKSAGQQYSAAKDELEKWKGMAHPFGIGAAPYQQQMTSASNILVSAGIDPRTMQPLQSVSPPAQTIPAAPTPDNTQYEDAPLTNRKSGIYNTPKGPARWDEQLKRWFPIPQSQGQTSYGPSNKYSNLPVDVSGNTGIRG